MEIQKIDSNYYPEVCSLHQSSLSLSHLVNTYTLIIFADIASAFHYKCWAWIQGTLESNKGIS